MLCISIIYTRSRVPYTDKKLINIWCVISIILVVILKMSNTHDTVTRHVKSIARSMKIPEQVGMFMSRLDRCNMILGIGNNSDEDRSRVEQMMSGGVFSGLHLITVSDDTNYDYVDSLTDDCTQHIAIKFDFCNNMDWFKIRKILVGKINIFTFDMSTTKFVNWRYAKFGSLDFNIFANIKLLIGNSGTIYYPVEPSKTIIPAHSSLDDEISLIDNMPDVKWVNKRFAISNTFVNIYRLEHIFPGLHTHTIKHLKSARTEEAGKITILTNNENTEYVRQLVDIIFNGVLNEHNSVVAYSDTRHNRVSNEVNIYFYYDTADLIHETYQVFKLSEMFDNVCIKACGPVTNIKYPLMTKGWIVASNNKQIFEDNCVHMTDINNVLPEYSYISNLVS